jgi:PAS domain S-box-containing protein
MNENDDKRVNILMVDDQPGKLLSYEVILEELGENLIKANSAREALDYLLRYDVAVVLLDVSMPELDGFELAAMIRQHPRYERTAIIFISAVLLTDFDRLRGYESGAVDYIPVPVVPELLRAKVRVFVDLYRKSWQLERLNDELEERVATRTAELEASTARLGDSEERFRRASDAAGAMVYDVDLLGERPAAVHGMERVVGLDSAVVPLTSDWWHSRIHPEDLPRHLENLERHLKAGDVYHAEYRVLRADGNWIDVEDTAQVIRDAGGAPVRLVGAVVDVTERKRAEATQQMLLEQETAARAEAETARAEAQAANRAKDEFLALISHELRSPLNAILGWSGILKTNPDAAIRQRAVETIVRNGRHQLRLIEDLMDTARVIGGKLQLEVQPVEVASIVFAAFDAVRAAAEAKQIALLPDFDVDYVQITGDPDRLQQIVWNLLSNAVKFTPEGGVVTVQLAYDDPYVRLVVHDTGHGIPRDFLPFVFDRFRQADASASRRFGGLGLGLALVRHLVELHGGTVEAHSDGEGLGARFTVRLPARAVQPSRDRSAVRGGATWSRADATSLAGVRVLVVDDEADARDLVATALGACGAIVEVADSGAEAIATLAGRADGTRFDVLVSDIGMPEMDGYALIRHVRAMDGAGLAELPAIALTAYASQEDRATALEAGFQAHVAKPVDSDELVAVISSLVGDAGHAAQG